MFISKKNKEQVRGKILGLQYYFTSCAKGTHKLTASLNIEFTCLTKYRDAKV